MTTILAGQRAAFTKALAAHNRTEDESQQRLNAGRMVEILKRSKARGFTPDQITQGRDVPGDVLALFQGPDPSSGALELPSEDPDRLVRELQQTVDTTDQLIMGTGNQCVYAYGYRCAPDRLKVGRTDADVITRVAGQISTGTPDKPVVRLVIRTDDCRGLEMAIHGFLRVRGRKVVGGGDEWYLTVRDELIEIYQAIVGSGAGESVPRRDPANGLIVAAGK